MSCSKESPRREGIEGGKDRHGLGLSDIFYQIEDVENEEVA